MTPLEVAAAWDAALAAHDVDALRALCAPDVVIVGPRGEAKGFDILVDWLSRAGARFETDRVHEASNAVVLEQVGVWVSGETGGEESRARVFTTLKVNGGRITRVARHETLAPALAETEIAV